MGKKFLKITRERKSQYLVNTSVINILSNYIPHETNTCDDKDPSKNQAY